MTVPISFRLYPLADGVITKMNHRKCYLDNLRWLCILMLLPFHAAMAFNTWGEANYIWFNENRILSSFIILIEPWYMPLLMVIAGISARYSLAKRGTEKFVKERLQKLFFPLIAGIVTEVAVMTYFADRFYHDYQGSFFEHYGIFFTRITDLTGYDGGLTPGHLWFLLYLFIISMLCLIPIALQKRLCPGFSCDKIHIIVVFCMGLIPFIVSPVLNFGGKSVASYTILFLLGYYILSEESVMDKIVKYRFFSLCCMMLTDIADVIMFIWMQNANGLLNTTVHYLATWFGILAIMGFAQSGFCQFNRVTQYFTTRSFGIYIFHMAWIVILQFYLCQITPNTVLLFLLPTAGAFVLTLFTVEMVRKIPVLRAIFAQI